MACGFVCVHVSVSVFIFMHMCRFLHSAWESSTICMSVLQEVRSQRAEKQDH